MVTESTELNPKQPSSLNDSLQELDELGIHPTQSGLEHTIELYATNLTALDEAGADASCEQILKVLVARDAVRTALNAEEKEVIKECLMTLFELDSRLKKQEEVITQGVNLADWRTSLNPPPDAWWWYFPPPIHQWDRYDWLWSTLAITCTTASFSLLADIAPRFWAGGPSTVGAFAVIGPSVLSLLAGGGALTQAGRTAVEKLLGACKIPKHFWQEVSCGASVLVLLGLVGFRFSLPQIAVWYNERGEKFHYVKENEALTLHKLASAEQYYQRAIKLDPNYATAYFNLGRLYGTRQELDKARVQYKVAMQLGSLDAMNNLARLYILDKKYSTAVELLYQGIDSLAGSKPSQQGYYLWKNLGWARLGQKRYGEAQEALYKAIELKNQVKFVPAAPNCLMAQALEGLGDQKAALGEWKTCAQYASQSIPEEDAWLDMAQKRLNSASKQ